MLETCTSCKSTNTWIFSFFALSRPRVIGSSDFPVCTPAAPLLLAFFQRGIDATLGFSPSFERVRQWLLLEIAGSPRRLSHRFHHLRATCPFWSLADHNNKKKGTWAFQISFFLLLSLFVWRMIVFTLFVYVDIYIYIDTSQGCLFLASTLDTNLKMF